MVRIALALACAAYALAAPQPQLSPDPSGDDNVGNNQGLQFITGGCLSDADCASGCCAGLASGDAVCSGPAVSFAQGKQGCGFGGDQQQLQPPPQQQQPEDIDDGGGAVDSAAPGAQNVGTGNGQQFITGQCLSDADCASGCCAGREGSATAACSAVLVADVDGKTGCGFGSA